MQITKKINCKSIFLCRDCEKGVNSPVVVFETKYNKKINRNKSKNQYQKQQQVILTAALGAEAEEDLA